MKKIKLILTFLFPIATQLFAQEGKLQNVQATAGIAAPAVKVDGNLKEWDDTFQAYNKQTKLFYTVSNDDQFLYLVVKSIDQQNNNKITGGGITFTVNTDGKKKDKDAFTLTYPVVAKPTFGGPGGAGGGGPRIMVFGGPGGGGAGGPDGFRDRGAAPDSAALAARQKRTITAAKEIKVLGFKDVTDTLISIYNEYGIKAAIGYDAVGNYNYELAIPLKMLNLTPADKKEIAYNLKVNGISMPNFPRMDMIQGGPGGGGTPDGGGGPVMVMDVRGGGPGGHGGPGGPGGGMPGGMAESFSTTDFWAKYTLAKK